MSCQNKATSVRSCTDKNSVIYLDLFKHFIEVPQQCCFPSNLGDVLSTSEKDNSRISFTLVFLCLVLVLLVKFSWSRRRLWHYGSKIQGPFAWPIIGSAYLFVGAFKDSYKVITNVINSQPPIFKLWMGPKLVVLTTQPSHAEVILKTCFNRQGTNHLKEIFRTGLVTAPVDIWKTRRKMIIKSFNTKIIHSFVEIFDKRTRHLVQQFEEKSDGNYIDVLETLIRCSLEITCETLLDVDPSLITGLDRYIANVKRMAKISLIRATRIWLHPSFVWRCSSLRKELTTLHGEAMDFLRQIIHIKKSQSSFCKNNYTDRCGQEKLFINALLHLESAAEKLEESDVLDEIHTILTGSESSGITNALVLCMMGLHPNIQKNIQEELDSIFDHSDRIVTLEDVNKMDYLERVIKETMRLFPPLPFIRRSVDEDIKLDSHILPKDSEVFIPVMSLHRRPDIWTDPLVFDPDRFLAENEATRPYYSYLPFSYGKRNCIASKYAMLSMKTILAIFFKHHEVHSTEYKSIEDVDFQLDIVAYPKNGCKVKLRKLKNKCF